MLTIARKELADALRNHWLQGYAVLIGVLGLVLALTSAHSASGLGMQTFGRTTASLTNLCLLLAPLVALALGAGAIAGERERGTLERLLAQPLSRSQLLLGKALGLAVSLLGATAIGFVPAAVVIVGAAGPGVLASFAIFPVLAALVICALLGVGLLVSIYSRNGGQALARALFLWFVLVLLYDLMVMGTTLTTGLRPAVLALLLLANPVSAGRLLVVLALEADLYLLGPAGAWLVETLSAPGAALLLVAALLAWTVIPLFLALRAFEAPLRPGRGLRARMRRRVVAREGAPASARCPSNV